MILGCFVDGISMILITMPIVFPIVTAIGFDGVLFGLLVVKMVEIGAITPPVGLNAFVVKGMSPGVELNDVFRRSEEHTSELQSLMRISYAVFCLKKKKRTITSRHKCDNTNL